jgi:oligopeptide/dipeptide ABC transporter ATP-binding protein
MTGDLLAIHDLHVRFATYRGAVHAVNGVDLTVRAGEILGVVGETGSGKSVTAHAILNLVRSPGKIVAGDITFDGHRLLALPAAQMEQIRGRDIAMIFQSPRASLNPLFTIGMQFEMYVRVHRRIGVVEARAQAIELLTKVGIADPARALRAFPHELSTGMCQRVIIAMALSCQPKLLIADEPTTGIDVTLQAQILTLMRDVVRGLGAALILITHDLGVVAEACDRVAVMYAGRVVEEGSVHALYADPRHPYTQALLASTLRVDAFRPIHVIPGAAPTLLRPPQACMFRTRCALAEARCADEDPVFYALAADQRARCHFADRTGGFAAVSRQDTMPGPVEVADVGVYVGV